MDDPEFDEMWQGFGALNINPVEITSRQAGGTIYHYKKVKGRYHAVPCKLSKL